MGSFDRPKFTARTRMISTFIRTTTFKIFSSSKKFLKATLGRRPKLESAALLFPGYVMGAGDHAHDNSSLSSNTLEHTKLIWRTTDAVCFDVDSTVSAEEGIDELAKFVGKGDDVAALTQQAMRGGMNYEDALRIRLSVIRPSLKMINNFLASNPPRMTPYVKELISTLQKRQVPVYLISGGFCCLNEPIAKALQIPPRNIFCNRIKFYYNGDYAGFDEDAPTAHSGGKGEIIQFLKNQFGYKKVVIIGDGVTDMEASPPADAFIGFGGNAVRDRVKTGAKWFVTDFRDLINELQRS